MSDLQLDLRPRKTIHFQSFIIPSLLKWFLIQTFSHFVFQV